MKKAYKITSALAASDDRGQLSYTVTSYNSAAAIVGDTLPLQHIVILVTDSDNHHIHIYIYIYIYIYNTTLASIIVKIWCLYSTPTVWSSSVFKCGSRDKIITRCTIVPQITEQRRECYCAASDLYCVNTTHIKATPVVTGNLLSGIFILKVYMFI